MLGLAFLAVATVACNVIVGFGNLTKEPTHDGGASGDDDTTDDDGHPPKDAGGSGNQGEASTSSGGIVPACNVAADFGTPVALPGTINSASFENSPSLTDDELSIVFQRTINNNQSILMLATRAKTSDAFGDPSALALTGTDLSFMPSITRDGLSVYWSEVSDSQNGGMDVFVATRNTIAGQFSNPQATGIASQTVEEQDPVVTGDGDEMFFASDQASPGSNKRQLFHANRSVGEFKNPTALTELNSNGDEEGVAVSKDGLTLFFGSTRTGGAGKLDVWTAHRNTRSEKFGAPTLVPAVNSPSVDWPSFISADGCRLYLGSEREGGGNLYVATKPR